VSRNPNGPSNMLSGPSSSSSPCHAKIRIIPRKPGEGYEFVNEIIGGAIPKEFIKPIDEGIKEALTRGVLAGYPIDDVRVELYDGSYHDVDSSEMSFKIAAHLGFKKAFEMCKPVLLEPIMTISVTVPDEHMGDVIGDLNSRRGQIEGMESRGGTQVVRAFVPLAQMFGYVTDLRSMSQGRATFTMEFKKYVEVPNNVAETVLKKAS